MILILRQNGFHGVRSCALEDVLLRYLEDGAVIGMGTIVSGRVPKGAIVVGAKNRIVGFRDLNSFDERGYDPLLASFVKVHGQLVSTNDRYKSVSELLVKNTLAGLEG